MSELHTDFCPFGVQGFACLQQEGDAIPSSIVDEAGHSSKGGAQTAPQSVWVRAAHQVVFSNMVHPDSQQTKSILLQKECIRIAFPTGIKTVWFFCPL